MLNIFLHKMDNILHTLTGGNNQQNNLAKLDLSQASNIGLSLILLRVPAINLIKDCTRVSKQWNAILSEKDFWKDKMEIDGHKLNWRELALAGLPPNSYSVMAVKQPLQRNFIQDKWDLTKRSKECLKMDGRWVCNKKFIWNKTDNLPDHKPRLEVPPVFLDGSPTEMDPELGEPVEACLATSYIDFQKRIVIRLADEGLNDILMDVFRPTIIVSELVANRRDCASIYKMHCYLSDEYPAVDLDYARLPHQQQLEKRFAQWEAEGWNRMQLIFKGYPAGMRFLTVICTGGDLQSWAGHYGVKMARCSVMAICEKNTDDERP